MLENRDEILKSDDETLSRLCELEFFKGSGNGGQKRNKRYVPPIIFGISLLFSRSL